MRVKRRDLEAIARIRADLKTGTARRAREAAEVTQAEMAAACEVTASAVSQWEDGNRTPKTRNSLAHARALERVRVAPAA